MSSGPIRAARDAWLPAKVSTPDATRVCFGQQTSAGLRGYCGRRSAKPATAWADVTCADCRAAARADGLAVA